MSEASPLELPNGPERDRSLGRVSPTQTQTQTSVSLLERLRRESWDESSWQILALHYGGKIRAWCLQRGLQPNDADDVAQDVLLIVARRIRDFDRRGRGSFRAWLRTIAYRTWCDYLARESRGATGTGDTGVHRELHSVAARDDFLQVFCDECDRELLQMAMRRVRDRVQPRTWEAFRLTALEETTGAEAARRVGISVASVFVARHRVQALIRREIDRLDDELVAPA